MALLKSILIKSCEIVRNFYLKKLLPPTSNKATQVHFCFVFIDPLKFMDFHFVKEYIPLSEVPFIHTCIFIMIFFLYAKFVQWI